MSTLSAPLPCGGACGGPQLLARAGPCERAWHLVRRYLAQGLFRSEDRGVIGAPFSSLNDDPQYRAWMGSAQDGTPDGPKLHSIIVDPRDAAHLQSVDGRMVRRQPLSLAGHVLGWTLPRRLDAEGSMKPAATDTE